tara:strand:+ start:8094 stop:8351 length:258 start_codon:yes stop_codon:yes gene_type:complete
MNKQKNTDSQNFEEDLKFLEKIIKEATFTSNLKEDKKIKDAAQTRIDYLRLTGKYLFFDSEATGRENGFLRKMLENENNNGGGII